jgi:hypothetical protein
MFQAVFLPITRSANCTHNILYMSSLLAVTASVGELALAPTPASKTPTTRKSVPVAPGRQLDFFNHIRFCSYTCCLYWQQMYRFLSKVILSTERYCGLESNPVGGERDFPHPYRPALRSIQLPAQWIADLFLRPRARVDNPPPSRAEVKERVEL